MMTAGTAMVKMVEIEINIRTLQQLSRPSVSLHASEARQLINRMRSRLKLLSTYIDELEDE